MSTKPSPHNISHANVRDTCATTTILEPMSTKPSPATFLELSVRPLGLAIPGASLLPYALWSFLFPLSCVLALAIRSQSTASFLASAGIA